MAARKVGRLLAYRAECGKAVAVQQGFRVWQGGGGAARRGRCSKAGALPLDPAKGRRPLEPRFFVLVA